MIRLWEFRDSISLRKLIRAFIIDQNKLGSDIAPSEENVTTFLNIGFHQSGQGQPHLVFEEKGKILGFSQMGEALYSIKFRAKTAEFFSIYVVPEERHKFVSIELIRRGGEILASLGFERLYSTVFLTNPTMLKNTFINPSIWPIAVRVEWLISADPQFEGSKLQKPLEKTA